MDTLYRVNKWNKPKNKFTGGGQEKTAFSQYSDLSSTISGGLQATLNTMADNLSPANGNNNTGSPSLDSLYKSEKSLGSGNTAQQASNTLNSAKQSLGTIGGMTTGMMPAVSATADATAASNAALASSLGISAGEIVNATPLFGSTSLPVNTLSSAGTTLGTIGGAATGIAGLADLSTSAVRNAKLDTSGFDNNLKNAQDFQANFSSIDALAEGWDNMNGQQLNDNVTATDISGKSLGRRFANTGISTIKGAGYGAATGAQFAGVGAIPGAIIGAAAGLLSGGIGEIVNGVRARKAARSYNKVAPMLNELNNSKMAKNLDSLNRENFLRQEYNYAAEGGQLNYSVGDELDLSEEEIDNLIKRGYKIKYI